MKRTTLIAAILLLALAPAQARKEKKFTHQITPIPVIAPQTIGIHTNGTSLILAVREDGTVHQLHFGSKVGEAEFAPVPYEEGRYGSGIQAYPATGGRYIGVPALHLKYADGSHNTELRYTGHEVAEGPGTVITTVHLKDYTTGVTVDLIYEAYPADDVIVTHSEITNGGKKPLTMIDYASGAIAIRPGKHLLSHIYGTWAQEWQLDSEPLTHGVKVLESRAGVQTTQCANPFFLLSLDSSSINEDSGEVVAGALEWSGNWRINFEIDPNDRLTVTGGINPYASEYPLAAGATFRTPDMVWTRSDEGTGGVSRNMHRWARRNVIYGGGGLCPILLNSWEGAYFTFNTLTLLRMMDDAASMGLEMFVLDDGWFGNKYPRNSDNAGLGDWQVNTTKLPEGIGYLASYAHSKGLKFGIWIEPEMVNPASVLAETHPDWVVQSPGRELYETRNQWILDMSNPAVQDFVFGVFDDICRTPEGIDYIKWDLNRMVASFGSPYLGEASDRFFIEYTQGFYSVMQRIRAKYPSVMVQCCSSGAGRVDYGALRYFNEVWTSDDTDALQRVGMQYAMSLMYPSCIMASHVSTVPNHQTGNVTPLKFRFDVACQGRLGLELQPRYLSADEMALVHRCVESYKGFRDIVETGDLYRLGSPLGNDFYGSMYVTPDKSRAVVYVYCIGYQEIAVEGHSFMLKGLDPGRKYRVTEQNVDKSCWWGNGQSFTGAFLQSGAFNPSLPRLYSSAVFVLEAE